MMKGKKVIKKSVILILTVFLIGGIFLALDKKAAANPIEEKYNALQNPTAKALYLAQSEKLTKAVPDRLIELDEKTIGCFGSKKIMEMATSDENLGGQCCGVLKSLEAYEAQLNALQIFITEHDNTPLIPKDPYDVPVSLAQQLIDDNTNILLTKEQQSVFDTAMQMSHHGGPCCCKCWKWDVMSGLGKKLIVDHGFSAEELAELWDLSSSCGHNDDTKMYEHYNKVTKEKHSES